MDYNHLSIEELEERWFSARLKLGHIEPEFRSAQRDERCLRQVLDRKRKIKTDNGRREEKEPVS